MDAAGAANLSGQETRIDAYIGAHIHDRHARLKKRLQNAPLLPVGKSFPARIERPVKRIAMGEEGVSESIDGRFRDHFLVTKRAMKNDAKTFGSQFERA